MTLGSIIIIIIVIITAYIAIRFYCKRNNIKIRITNNREIEPEVTLNKIEIFEDNNKYKEGGVTPTYQTSRVLFTQGLDFLLSMAFPIRHEHEKDHCEKA